MKAVRDFADKGGLVGAADDAGFIYTLYGFTYLSELELLQEAGFHPLDVIQCATGTTPRSWASRTSSGGCARASWPT